MILVFVGAGASAAVDSEQYPTTVGFYERLDADIKSAIDGAVGGSLRSQINMIEKKGFPVDIEELIWIIDRALGYIDACGDKDDVIGRALIGTGFGIENILSDWRRELFDIKENVYRELYRLYGEPDPPLDPKKFGVWINSMKVLSDIGVPVEIVTTNYDLVLETVINGLELKVESGFRLNHANKAILDPNYLTIPIGGDDKSFGRLVKLHGSINWHREGGNIVSGVDRFTGDHSDRALIYPGDKINPKGIFKKFYDHLAATCSKVKIAIFIGFSFRDELINTTLAQNIPENAPKIIINKDKEDRTFHDQFPFSKGSCSHIDKGFTKEIAKEIESIRNPGPGFTSILEK